MNNPSEKHRLSVIGYGGTIMARPTFEKTTSGMYLMPREDSLIALDSKIPHRLRNSFEDITYETRDLIDSSQARADTNIADIVCDVRRCLESSESNVFILLYGTDTMADLMAALGNGVSKEELGNKTVIVTGSMHHVESEDPPTDAIPNYLHALKVGSMQESRGKIGLLFGERFFPPRGIEKIRNGERFPFQCRFHRMAKFHRKDKKWVFRDPQPVDIPQGSKNENFRLTMGIETHGLTATSDYKNFAHAISRNKATVLLAPGDGNLRTDKESLQALKKATEKAIGPIVVVPDALQDAEDALVPDSDWPDAVYCGHGYGAEVEKLIPGGAMTRTEVRIWLSQHIAKLEEKGIQGGDEVYDYISSSLALYPFRDADSGIS